MLQRTAEEENAEARSIVAAAPAGVVSQQDTLSTEPSVEETKRWIASIEAGMARSKRRGRIVWWGNGVHYAAVFIFLGVVTAFLHGHKSQSAFPYIYGMMFYLNFLVPFFNGIIRIKWSEARRLEERVAVRQVAAMDDPVLVGPLIDALSWNDDTATRLQICRALTRLLPHLTEEQARDLGKQRHGLLATWLREWEQSSMKEEPAFLSEMLHVLAAVGRERIETESLSGKRGTVSLLPILNPWTQGKQAGRDPVVRQAAIACRDAILSNQASARSGEQLLRASTRPGSRTADLLHPVQGVPETAPQELLRPDSTERTPPEA